MGWPSEAAGTASSHSPPTPPDRSSSPPPPYQPWESYPSPDASGSPALLEPQPRTRPQYAMHAGDPRTSSTQSLVPSMHADEARRVLLIVYIHGFMGNNTSFRSFPAHVHSYLKEALADSHVIHSKVYPRYKTYKAIEVARDNFSKWLEPHESARTDTVLVGHSMGGLLAADVALMPSSNPTYGRPLKHRILGTISMDAPLLGLHPGIIKSGIASLFRKAPDPPGKEQELAQSLAAQNASGSLSIDDGMSFSTDGVSSSGMTSPMPLTSISSNASGQSRPDPTFNPPFFNDVQFVDRGWWRNVAHFAKKHYSEGILTSTYQHLLSHLEFGACLADYPALKARYSKIRRLEDVDELHSGALSGRGEVRVRYVNYYTVSTGIPKEPPQPSLPQPPVPKRSDTHLRPEPPEAVQSYTANSSQASTPKISIEDYSDGEGRQSMQILEPVPEPDSEPDDAEHQPPSKNEKDTKGKAPASSTTQDVESGEGSGEHGAAGGAAADPEAEAANKAEEEEALDDLPAIPPAPEPPQAPDLERYTDKDARKQAEKEFRRVQKTYEQAVKNREKALRERQKLVEKRRKKAQKETEKRQKEEEKRVAKEHKAQQAAAAKQKSGKNKKKQDGDDGEDGDGDDEDEDDAAAADQHPASRAQVVTPAQAQALEQQLTDLAFHDGHQDDARSPPLSPELTNTNTNTTNPLSPTGTNSSNPRGKKAAAVKLHKFCMLPPKVDGRRDPAWVQVHMEGVDEVGAHCGLFFLGPHYEKLVGDVGARIVGWVQEDLSKNAILALD